MRSSHFENTALQQSHLQHDGIKVRQLSARWELTSTPRLSTYERPKRPGFVRLFADREQRVLVGAVTVGPQATEWLGQLTLAIRSATPVDVLLDTIQPYPSFSEAIFFCLRELSEKFSA